MERKRLAILGSTGSIGQQTLQVVSERDDIAVCGLAGGGNWKLLCEQATQFRPQVVAIAEPSAAEDLRGALPADIDLFCGPDAMSDLVERVRPDILLSGVVGAAGLTPTLKAIECGSRLAIANKETLVMAGAIIVPAARRGGIEVLPVDSEHSAIFQCLQGGSREELARVVITASGGALRDWTAEQIAEASLSDALNHPTWNMGRKITIDSATMMNKALEVVEAHWLFDLSCEQIEVVIHPESIIHSYVEFQDGSVIAQMNRPDMTLPIAYALGYPHRTARDIAPLDLPRIETLTFRTCEGRFARAVGLGYEAIRKGGLSGAVLNSANEAAVEAFTQGKISFTSIVPMVEDVLNLTPQCDEITVESLLQADSWARRQVEDLIDDNVRTRER